MYPQCTSQTCDTSTNNDNNNQFMTNYQNYLITYFEQFGNAKRY